MGRITVAVYARNDVVAGFIKAQLLKADPNIVFFDPPAQADAVIIDEKLLTPTEKKILKAYAKFGKIEEVATAENYTYATVKRYLSRIYTKLRVKGGAQAVAFALRYQLIDLEE